MLFFFCALTLPIRSLAQGFSTAGGTQADRFLDLNSEDYKNLATRILVKNGNKISYYQNPSENILDENLGFRPPRNQKVRTIMRTEKEIIFDATYSFDQFGRRTSPVSIPGSRKKFLLLNPKG